MFAEWPQLNYHERQAAYLLSKKKFNYLPCGRQSGKTELAMRKLVAHLSIKKDHPDPRYFYAGPTYAQVKKVAWDRILNLIPPHWIAGEPSVSELSIKTVFGSELFLVGLDKPQRIEGLIIDGGVIDECSDIKPGTFDKSILLTLAHRDGWCDFIGVPKRFGIGATEYQSKCKKAAKGDLPDSAMFTWSSEGIIPDSKLEHYRAILDIRDFDELINATWLSASGGVFHAFDSEFNVRACVYDSNLPIVVGSDFNVNPMVWILGHLKGNTFEVFDEIWVRDTNTPATLDMLLSRYGNHTGHFEMYGDASARGRHTSAYMTDYNHIVQDIRLKELGRSMHYTRSNPPVADRFATTNARICSGDGVRHVFIDKRCEHLILDLETRGYKPGTREADDSGDTGHPTDALGYVLHKKFPLRLEMTTTTPTIIFTKPEKIIPVGV